MLDKLAFASIQLTKKNHIFIEVAVKNSNIMNAPFDYYKDYSKVLF